MPSISRIYSKLCVDSPETSSMHVGVSRQADLHLEGGDPDKLKRMILEDYQMQGISPESLNTAIAPIKSRVILSKK